VIVFLAIDSRIVVASIEQHINKSMKIEDAMINGWEYLEKIVQIPFCIPEVSHEIVNRYLKSILIKNITVIDIESILFQFKNTCEHIQSKLKQMEIEQSLCCKFPLIQCSEQYVKIPATKILTAFEGKYPLSKLSSVARLLKCPSFMMATSNDREEVERLCGEVLIAINRVQFYVHRDLPSLVNISIPDAKIAGSEDDDSADGMKAINVKEEGLGDLLFEGENSDGEKLVKISMAFNEEFQRLPETMSAMLESVIGKVECNPRSVKRSVNLLQIISEIAKNKPVTGTSPPVTIAKWEGGKKWKIFSEKTVLWIFMAQNFTFRLSALVQVLLDFEQKKDFNELSLSYKYKQHINFDNGIAALSDQVDNFDEMSIFEFYQKYVEKFIHVFLHTDRLSRVDKDPEEFAFLLGKCHAIGVKCEDILGHEYSEADGSTRRRKDFSLLSYSFNLDPAMRLEIGDDMASLISEHEMSGDKGFILQKESMIRKKDFLYRRV